MGPFLLFALHRWGDSVEGSVEIGHGVYQGGRWTTILNQAKEQESPSSHLRFFLGYAGWNPGQLAAEIANGAWHLLPASRDATERIFSSSPEECDRDLMLSL